MCSSPVPQLAFQTFVADVAGPTLFQLNGNFTGLTTIKWVRMCTAAMSTAFVHIVCAFVASQWCWLGSVLLCCQQHLHHDGITHCWHQLLGLCQDMTTSSPSYVACA